MARRSAHPGTLSLSEVDLDPRRGSLLVRHGKGGRRREVGMDAWGWQQLQPWLQTRLELPVGPLFCIITGPTRGRHWATAAAREELRRTAATAGGGDGSLPTSSGTPTPSRWPAKACRSSSFKRQLGHSNLGITSVYLQGIDNAESIDTVHARPTPMVQVSALLRP